MNGVPSTVWKTTVPLPPDASGKVAARWSVTLAVSVPGIVISPAGALPLLRNAPTVIARMASQVPITTKRRRVANRPIR